MSQQIWPSTWSSWPWSVWLALARGPAATAQAVPRRPRSAGDVETDPITCWWKTDRTPSSSASSSPHADVRRRRDRPDQACVPNRNQLEPTTLQLAPFEVVGGRPSRGHPGRRPGATSSTNTRVRLLGEASSVRTSTSRAQDHATTSSRRQGGESEGRDQTYVLPAMPMRVTRSCRRTAADIRDASTRDIRRHRGAAVPIDAGAGRGRRRLFAFAVVLLGLALVRVVGRYRVRAPAWPRPLPARRRARRLPCTSSDG